MAVVPAFGALAKRLIRLAGYRTGAGDQAVGGLYAPEFADVLLALQYIGNRKVDDYGDFRLQDIRSWDRETWGAYWDLQRKFGRLENQLHTGTNYLLAASKAGATPEGAREKIVDDLMESCSDLAVYAVRMIQILKRLEEKEMVP